MPRMAFLMAPCAFTLLFATTFFLRMVCGDPRHQAINITCTKQPVPNATTFVQNFLAAMEEISEKVSTTRFGVATVGSTPDATYGLAQCYGDLSLLDCVLCYAEARTALPPCFPYNGSRIYLDGCFMRVQNSSFFDKYEGPPDKVICGNITRKNSTFEASTRQAVTQAVANGLSNSGYAQVQAIIPGTVNDSAYVLVDCWKTLKQSACQTCLEKASASILKCLPWSEARALYAGCFMRYSDHDFLNKEQDDGNSRGNIVVIVISIVSATVVLAVGVTIGAYFWKHRTIQKKRKGSNDAEKLVKTLNNSSLNFKYSTLEKATGSFDEANKLGQGGFGTVYKGVLPDGREIAVKRLFYNNKHRAANFYNEVNIISSVERRNLVRLLGCSCSGPESLLVYEYLPNKSLDRFIFDENRGKTLNWEKRFEIILGTADGLAYLHENSKTKIIHRDIKASNILLDSRLRGKIADFGLARSFQEDKSHISTAIAGTLGYMAPEYLVHGQLTDKVDVYSFGVLLLEVVTGRQNNKSKTSDLSDSLVTVTWRHFQSGSMELYDPNLMLHNDNNIKDSILRVVHIGLLCTQEISKLRPKMSKVLQMLLKKEENLPAATNPPFVEEKTMELRNPFEGPSQPLYGVSGSVATVSFSSFYPR